MLLYAHHDVQPENDPADWDSPPFEPTERDGRLYGRGAADDKAGIVAHLGALRAFGDDLPVERRDLHRGRGGGRLRHAAGTARASTATSSRADVIVIADSGNWDIGEPALTTSLRGLVRAVRRGADARPRRPLRHVRRRGARTRSSRCAGCSPRCTTTPATWRSQGLVAGPARRGRLSRGPAPRRVGHRSTGVEWIGDGPIVERLWTKPALTVTRHRRPHRRGASNTLVPMARAKLCRAASPPATTTANAAERAARPPASAHAPWGAQVTVHPRGQGRADRDRRHRPGLRRRAGGVHRGLGRRRRRSTWGSAARSRSSPSSSELFPDASVLVTGVEDPDTRAHGANEGLHLAEFERVVLAEALLLRNLGGQR